jgi:hypothetical protein
MKVSDQQYTMDVIHPLDYGILESLAISQCYFWKSELMNLKAIKSPMIKRFSLCLLSLIFVISTGAVAEDLLLTGYLGYRVGGDFTDIPTTTELELAETESYGLIIGKDNGTSSQMEFLYSIQPNSG